MASSFNPNESQAHPRLIPTVNFSSQEVLNEDFGQSLLKWHKSFNDDRWKAATGTCDKLLPVNQGEIVVLATHDMILKPNQQVSHILVRGLNTWIRLVLVSMKTESIETVCNNLFPTILAEHERGSNLAF
jgi:hypothetical protein